MGFISGDSRLSVAVRGRIRAPENEVYLSAVSVWEAIVKYPLGKLPLPYSPEQYLSEQRERHQIASLALDEASVRLLVELPAIHRDPFDRMLICQALHHSLVIVTADATIPNYPVAVVAAL